MSRRGCRKTYHRVGVNFYQFMKKELTKTGAYWLSFLFSILLFLIVCWSAAFQDATAYWVESLGYFLLTYICIYEFSKRKCDVNPWMIGFAVILGQMVFQIPIRAVDFWGAYGSLMIAVSCILATILAVFCYKDKRPYTFILSYVVMSLFNSCMADMWSKYVLG